MKGGPLLPVREHPDVTGLDEHARVPGDPLAAVRSTFPMPWRWPPSWMGVTKLGKVRFRGGRPAAIRWELEDLALEFLEPEAYGAEGPESAARRHGGLSMPVAHLRVLRVGEMFQMGIPTVARRGDGRRPGV
jgi:hypothetical protein